MIVIFTLPLAIWHSAPSEQGSRQLPFGVLSIELISLDLTPGKLRFDLGQIGEVVSNG